MLWQYIGLVLSFAFRRSTVRTDIMQILAASALPALAKFAGLKMPQSATGDVLAYIGLAAIAFIALRLLSAPFFIWRDQTIEIGTLKVELSKPERRVMEHLARHRAKARAKLAASLEDFQTLAFTEDWNQWCIEQAATRMSKIRRLHAAAGLSEAFESGRRSLLVSVQSEGAKPNASLPLNRESERLLKLLQNHLVGDLTAEALALQLHPSTVAGTQP